MNQDKKTVSVLGVNLVEPILKLIDILEGTPFTEPNEVHSTPQENGHSCGIITLNVMLLESAINRTKFIRHEHFDRDQVKYFAKLTSDVEQANDIDEVIAIRDAIIHNHLWISDVYWDENYQLRFRTAPNLVEGFGNARLRRVMDVKTRQSKRLKLNLYPLRIWRADAYTSLRVVATALNALESIDRNYFCITNQYFTFRGNSHTLKQVVEILPKIQQS